ncbi:MAG: DUF2142 domain-containing protein [Pseudobutyrivibrio sp.]|nr:DUF2142 domain-containing protein [Pseudobutyrivibrio sp.]
MTEIFTNKKVQIALKITAVFAAVVVLARAGLFFTATVFDGALSVRYNLFMAIPLVCMFVATAYFLWLLLRKKEFRYEQLFVVLAICWGIVMQIVMPPLSGPDENTHYLAAYHGSNVVMFTNDWGFAGKWWFRIEDTQYPQYHENFPDEYQLLADGSWFGITPGFEGLTTNPEITVLWYRYPFSSVGIALARLLNLGCVGLLYAGRFMNTLAFIILGYLCVKFAPVGKAQIVGLTMLPLIMELCNSYSYDNLSILMSLLFAVLCMHYSLEDTTFRFRDLFILTTIYAVLIPNKIVYVLFLPMVFMIPMNKWKGLFSEKNKKTAVTTVIYGIYAAAVVYFDFFKWTRISMEIITKDEGSSIEQAARPAFTIGYMIKHPLEVLKLLWDTFRYYAWEDVRAIFGEQLGSHILIVYVATGLIVALIIIVILGLVLGRGRWIGKKQFLWFLLTAFLVLGAIIAGCLVRFTPTDGTDRLQVSARYYVPIFVLSMVFLGTDKKENKLALTMLYAQNLVYVLVMCDVLRYLITYGA